MKISRRQLLTGLIAAAPTGLILAKQRPAAINTQPLPPPDYTIPFKEMGWSPENFGLHVLYGERSRAKNKLALSLAKYHIEQQEKRVLVVSDEFLNADSLSGCAMEGDFWIKTCLLWHCGISFFNKDNNAEWIFKQYDTIIIGDTCWASIGSHRYFYELTRQNNVFLLVLKDKAYDVAYTTSYIDVKLANTVTEVSYPISDGMMRFRQMKNRYHDPVRFYDTRIA